MTKKDSGFNIEAEAYYPKKNPLEEDFDEIEENNLPENDEEFFSQLKKMMDSISKLANPIKF